MTKAKTKPIITKLTITVAGGVAAPHAKVADMLEKLAAELRAGEMELASGTRTERFLPATHANLAIDTRPDFI